MSTIIVDGSVQDAVVEYGVILDAINKTSSTQELSKAISNFNDEAELIDFLNSTSLDIILELNERDLEPVFNLYLYLLSNLTDGFEQNLQKAGICEKFLKKVENTKTATSNTPTILISVLTTVFNVLPAESPVRFEILSAIVEIVIKTSNLKLILGIKFETLQEWLSPIKNARETAEFLLYLIKSLQAEYPVESLSLYESLVGSSLTNSSLTEDELNQFLIQSFNDEIKLDLSNYSQLNLSRASQNFQELLTFYNAKDLTSFETFYNANDSAFKAIDYNSLKLKLQVIKLISTCYGSSNIKYETLKPILQLSSDEALENLIIYSIKKQFIQGKLNQFNHSLQINHVKYLGDFNLENWKLVQSKLDNWKSSLKEIKDNIDNKKK